MRKILISTLIFVAFQAKSQTCCNTLFASNDGTMAGFVNDVNFRNMHEVPLKYTHVSNFGGEMITFATDSEKANAYLIKSKTKSNKWLFVYQEWWGLNDHIKKEAETFYNELGQNVNVLAIDMYDGKIATTPDQAGSFMKATNENRLEQIMKGAIKFTGNKSKIASVGWCFGGALSLKSAILEGKKAVGCVMYYGMPVSDLAKLKLLQTDVLGLFATEQWISKQVIEDFAANMQKCDKKLNYKIFDAAHAFANPSNPKHDAEKAAEAHKMALTYLKSRL